MRPGRPTEAAAWSRPDEFSTAWAARYPAILRLWESVWSQFVPVLDYDVEFRRIIYSTNAIERSTPATAARCGPADTSHRTDRPRVHLPGHPIPGPHRTGRARWGTRWKPALNVFAITFEGRLNPTGHN